MIENYEKFNNLTKSSATKKEQLAEKKINLPNVSIKKKNKKNVTIALRKSFKVDNSNVI